MFEILSDVPPEPKSLRRPCYTFIKYLGLSYKKKLMRIKVITDINFYSHSIEDINLMQILIFLSYKTL